MTIFQGDETLCGWAATRMMLVALTHDKGFERLSLKGKSPFSLLELSLACKKAGVRLSFRRAHAKEELRKVSRFPLLLLVAGGEGGHLVMGRARLGGFLLVDDPAEGRKWVSISSFLPSWTGIFGEGELIDRHLDRPRRKKGLLPFFPRLLLFLEEGAAASSMALGAFFLPRGPAFLSPLLFLCSALFVLGGHFLSLSLLRKVDRECDPLLADLDDDRFKEAYARCQSLKKGLVADFRLFSSSFFAGISLLGLLAAESAAFLLSGGLLILYLLFAGFLRGRIAIPKIREIAKKEKDLLSKPREKAARLSAMRDIEGRSYSAAVSFSLRRITETALILFLASFPPFLAGSISVEGYLYSAFALFAFRFAFEGASRYLFERPRRRSDLDYFDQRIARI